MASPTEPSPPSRWRGPLLVVATTVVVVGIVATVLRISAATQAQDPALDPGLVPAPAEQDPTSAR